MLIVTICCITALACAGAGLGLYGLGFVHGYAEGRQAGELEPKKLAVPVTVSFPKGSRRASIILGTPWLAHAGRAS